MFGVMKALLSVVAAIAVIKCAGLSFAAEPPTANPAAEFLSGTEPLTLQGDIASNLVAGVDRFLLRELEASEAQRARYWHRDYSSAEAYQASVATNRARLAHILGVRDTRVRFKSPELLATLSEPAVLCRAKNFDILAVRWPALDGMHGEGLLLAPHGGKDI